ncbi:hypothetical protein SM0020_10215 [Sinorhizobium meliloti CCNWSX0020]|uniref:Uncharacterized protein n=1 Tax=Sinorhizobium meliloti CCNWSX0020 TaxID=1107881 RepID=H0FXX3_RHIML|nr:hypothetical protein [Sinorhizobium meliloti]EHK78045.1 hypothetical protein SM0020_10215 [Sinorhizobium meliloti CCNWSX0020]
MSADAKIIPVDIMKAAEEALDNLLCNCRESCGSHEAVRQASIKEIALALFAERERCAAVADYFSQACVCSEWTEEARGAGYYACADVATSIRNPSPPKQPSPPTSDDDLPF